MNEITIEIDFHTTEECAVIDYDWYAAFVKRNDDYADILWYGFPFETYEEAENAARDYLRGLVGETQP